MRKVLAIGVALSVAAGLVGAAGASTPTKKKPPVKLDGKVENGGTATVKNDAVTIVTDDFLFKKTFLKVKPGTAVTVTLRNDGSAPHTLTAKDGSFDTEVAPGSEATVEVAIPAGNAPVVFFCRFHGASKDASMKGAFFTKKGVKEGAAAGSGGSSGSGGTTPSTQLPGYGY